MDFEHLTGQMANNAKTILSLTRGVSVEQARWRPAPESWSILEVINHLYDEEEDDFRQRLDCMLHHPDRPWQSIDPKGRVAERGYNERDLEESVGNFLRVREDSLAWLRGLLAPDWQAAPFERMTAGDMFASWVAHDLLHIRQLVELQWAYLVHTVRPHKVDFAGTW
jgi:hypothetical protein